MNQTILVQPKKTFNQKEIEASLAQLCSSPDQTLAILFIGSPDDYIGDKETSLPQFCRLITETGIYDNPSIMGRLSIAFSNSQIVSIGHDTLKKTMKNQASGQSWELELDMLSISENSWGKDVTIPEDAQSALSLAGCLPFQRAASNTIKLLPSKYENELSVIAHCFSQTLSLLSATESDLINNLLNSGHSIQCFGGKEFDQNWYPKFEGVKELSHLPILPSQKGKADKTKHWVFSTGGSDSTLIQTSVLKLMEKNSEDELVIVPVINSTLGSGQQQQLEPTMMYVMANIIDLGVPQHVIDRISVVIPNNEFIVGDTPAELEVNDRKLSLNFVKYPNLKELSELKTGMIAQELVVVAGVLPLIPYLGKCANKFYLGACASDYATPSSEKLKLMFQQVFSMIGDANPQINKSWLPQLETPLLGMKKQSVIYNLELLGSRNFAIDKSEDLLIHYGMNAPQALEAGGIPKDLLQRGKSGNISLSDVFSSFMKGIGVTDTLAASVKIYHSLYLQLGRPKEFTNLTEFLKTGELSFSRNGKRVEVDPAIIEDIRHGEIAQLLSRSSPVKLPKEPDINLG